MLDMLHAVNEAGRATIGNKRGQFRFQDSPVAAEGAVPASQIVWPLEPPRADKTAVELCCGMGGIGIGLEAAGYRVVGAYDIWAAAVAIYNHNAPKSVAKKCDILSGEGREIIGDSQNLKDVDLLAAGPPCKGFSQIRNGRHDQPNAHNEVLLAIPEYVALLRPRLFLIENVPALSRHRGGQTLDYLLNRLRRPSPRSCRYRVGYGIYDAALFGTPQARRRLLIFGVREGSGDEQLPPESPDLGPLFAALRHGGRVPNHLKRYQHMLTDPGNLQMTTAEQAMSDLPVLEPGEPEIPRAYLSSPANAFQKVMRVGAPNHLRNTRTPHVRDETVRRLEMIPAGGCARDIPPDKLNGLTRRFDSAYRRLHPESPSTALSTKYDCVFHYEQQRSLSVREYARLQGVPDRFEFPENLACRRHAYEMIGNSVPPFLVYGVLIQLVPMNTLGKTR